MPWSEKAFAECPKCGGFFSPRKQDLTVYIMPGFEKYTELMEQLGKHRTGKSCLYIKRLSDIHVPTLKKLIRHSVKEMKRVTKKRSANSNDFAY